MEQGHSTAQAEVTQLRCSGNEAYFKGKNHKVLTDMTVTYPKDKTSFPVALSKVCQLCIHCPVLWALTLWAYCHYLNFSPLLISLSNLKV